MGHGGSDTWLASAPALPAADGTPAHVSIARWLMELIGRGDLVEGDRLPREQELAALLGVSRMTLRQALAGLEARGTVQRKTGRAGGTFVREARIECDLTGLAGFTEQMRRANLRAGARVITAAAVPANPMVARALQLAAGEPVFEVARVRTVKREPLAVERSYFPAAAFPRLLDHRLTGSLYALLGREYGRAPVSAVEALDPVAAPPAEAELLKVPAGSPLMQIERTAFAAGGLAVEFARDLFRPDRIRISLRTGIGRALDVPTRLDVVAG